MTEAAFLYSTPEDPHEEIIPSKSQKLYYEYQEGYSQDYGYNQSNNYLNQYVDNAEGNDYGGYAAGGTNQINQSQNDDKNVDNTVAGRDWNEEFQDLYSQYRAAVSDMYERSGEDVEYVRTTSVDRIEKRRNLSIKMSSLFNEFIQCSSEIAKKIVCEKKLPASEKTIKPSNVGGIAGGDKYFSNNIFFKFAEDVVIDEKANTTLYGDTEFALKAASHELKGVIALMDVLLDADVHFPLFCLIDYGGYRIVACAKLPLNKTTLVVGSNDAGKTVHIDDLQVYEITKNKIAPKLNLKGHSVGRDKKVVYGPGDLECHRGLDKRIYIVDTARLFCPEKPTRKGSVFYRLFRPEFLKKYSKPLSSDCFTGWGRQDSKEHDGEATEATEHLYQKTIPSFAKYLDDALDRHPAYLPREQSILRTETTVAEHKLTTEFDLVGDLHRYGINIRHMGIARSKCNSKLAKEILFIEMACRTIKNILRAKFRECPTPNEDAFSSLVVSFVENFQSHSEEIKEKLSFTFTEALSQEESENFGRIFGEIMTSANFISRLSKLVNIVIVAESGKLRAKDAEQACSRIKYISLIQHEEAVSLQHLGETASQSPQKIEYLVQAVNKYGIVSDLKPYSSLALYNCGKCYRSLSEHANDDTGKRLLLSSAISKYAAAHCNADEKNAGMISVNWANVLFDLGMLCSARKQKQEALQLFEEANKKYSSVSESGRNDTTLLSNWSSLLSVMADLTPDKTKKKEYKKTAEQIRPKSPKPKAEEKPSKGLFNFLRRKKADPAVDMNMANPLFAAEDMDLANEIFVPEDNEMANPIFVPKDYSMMNRKPREVERPVKSLKADKRPEDYPLEQSIAISPTEHVEKISKKSKAKDYPMKQSIPIEPKAQDYRIAQQMQIPPKDYPVAQQPQIIRPTDYPVQQPVPDYPIAQQMQIPPKDYPVAQQPLIPRDYPVAQQQQIRPNDYPVAQQQQIRPSDYPLQQYPIFQPPNPKAVDYPLSNVFKPTPH